MSGMPLVEKNHQLRRGHWRQRCALCHRPPQEFAGGETAQAQPESITVIHQKFESRRRTIAEDVQGAGERILLPVVPAKRRQRVKALAEINRFDRQQNA